MNFTTESLVDELLCNHIITPNSTQKINPNAERMLVSRGRNDLIGAIHHFTDFITSLSNKKLKDRITVLYRDRFSAIDDVPICMNDDCNKQVEVLAGPYRTLGIFCCVKCANIYRNKQSKFEIDPVSGLTKAKLYSNKMRDTLKNTVDKETGLTLEQLRGMATSSGLTNITENGKSIAQERAKKEAERRATTILTDGRTLHDLYGQRAYEVNKERDNFKKTGEKVSAFYKTPEGKIAKKLQTKKQRNTKLGVNSEKDFSDPDTSRMYRIYRRRVNYFTNQVSHLLPCIEKRGNHATNKDAWHIDHKFPVAMGFELNIPPYIMGSIHNLEMLPWGENIMKMTQKSITLEELCEAFFSEVGYGINSI